MRRLVVSVFVLAFLCSAIPAGAQLPEGGAISGTVTNADGDPIADICVEANGDSWEWHFDRTAEDGTYSIDVSSGTYRVQFYDCRPDSAYVSEWYNDKPDYDSADPVDVSDGETSGIDAVLARGGSITGTITNEADEPLADICVSAQAFDYPYGYGHGYTDSLGGYTIGGLTAGSYIVSFHDCSYPQGYQSEYYDDAEGWDDADRVDVALGAVTSGIDAVLAEIVPFDLAVDDVSVENVPLRTDHGPVGYTGTARTITVTVSNLADQTGDGYLQVRVCPRTAGLCRPLDAGYVTLGGGETLQSTIAWNGAGTVGDVRISAYLYSFGYDEDESNNFGEIDHYVLVGGTGVGVGL